MLLYVTLGTNGIVRAGHFYDTVLPVPSHRRQRDAEEEITIRKPTVTASSA